MKKYYPSIRALHLYIGLFISPFILVFAVSVLVFDHLQLLSEIRPVKKLPVTTVHLDSIPFRGTDILTARAILTKINHKGEIDYLVKNDSSMFFPVKTPWTADQVTVDTKQKLITVQSSDQGILRGTAYLHSMPGPHNAAIRGNSEFIKVWRYLIDTLVYSLLFLTISGVVLWYFLRQERKLGLVSVGIGFLIFITLLFLTF